MNAPATSPWTETFAQPDERGGETPAPMPMPAPDEQSDSEWMATALWDCYND